VSGSNARIRGYTDRPSVAQGERIRFFVSNLHGALTLHRPIRIFRVGLVETEVAADTIAVPPQAVPEQGWNNNKWAETYALTVGREWDSGVYVGRVGQGADDTKGIYFVVRNSQPASATPIVVQIPTATINAYSNWGGSSLYSYNSGGLPACAVSFDRPQQSDPLWPRGYGFEEEWELRIKALVQWLELAGLRADFMTNADLHRSARLRPYRLFISVGHDEYWSHEMRQQFDAFIAAGGNAAIFGGNTCYWQVRFEPDEDSGTPDRRQVCYKFAGKDPVADPALKTVRWRETGRAENLSFGAGGSAGAWQGGAKPGVFRVTEADHWVFAGTALSCGDTFGNAPDETVLCYETSGVRVGYDGAGRPFPSGKDDTPRDYRILAFADLPDWGTPGNAALGVLTRADGGTVFNAATTEWAKGLEACIVAKDPLRTVTAKITRTVIARLAQEGRAPSP
jgi:hypothetical protein